MEGDKYGRSEEDDDYSESRLNTLVIVRAKIRDSSKDVCVLSLAAVVSKVRHIDIQLHGQSHQYVMNRSFEKLSEDAFFQRQLRLDIFLFGNTLYALIIR